MVSETSDMSFLPYGRQTIEEDDVNAVISVLKSDFLTTGPAIPAFEKKLEQTVGASHAVLCNSGTAALHLAFKAIGLTQGDKVIVPAQTFVATASAAMHEGAEVILCDVDPSSGLMTAEYVKDALRKTAGPVKAICPVLLNGSSQGIDEVVDLAKSQDITVIIDACHALGGYYDEARIRRIGGNQAHVLTAFSFHPVKTIAMGEGGAVTTHSEDFAESMRSLRHHGIQRADFKGSLTQDYGAPWYHEFHSTAYNYRASDMQAALGLSQLAKLDRFVEGRRLLVAEYCTHFDGDPIITPVASIDDKHSAWHLMAVHLNFDKMKVDKIEVVKALKEKNIGTQVHYIPLQRQPLFERKDQQALTGADRYYQTILSLPLYPSMTKEDVAYVSASLKGITQKS
ncbi:UDP-4-amino-4,6-dideoxy-N-acetyl-beta-L-altrosamine transaminase [Temperatibacter marinus]|uniref:UDP-4-amino-4, 6-dideoxy-N-acetyl-beta-L-altrosamine transaminase n=1 Tax=Temperatibacter marinus TaxID=1456591 RepID=A0AA52H7Y2_9PROT|nr:UDP-4-amino-4,6-dideoxy-N-acetyl-beta-L-altrosamine transaminase [Temperatibacter marinus]WND01551.1 UDP-4-amino-4,6-dideoxy-N-acetyl-beta-L-altrosamine transaminase [Temperatibacter marinus]